MNKIKILSDRKTSSHILSGETITDIVQYLESYPRIFVLYDISVKGYADKLIHKINDINGTTGNQKTVDSFAMIAEEEKKTCNLLCRFAAGFWRKMLIDMLCC